MSETRETVFRHASGGGRSAIGSRKHDSVPHSRQFVDVPSAAAIRSTKSRFARVHFA